MQIDEGGTYKAVCLCDLESHREQCLIDLAFLVKLAFVLLIHLSLPVFSLILII